MPGLIRGIARTAVVAGTATAVSNNVSRRQAGRWAAQEQQHAAPQPAYAEPVAAPGETAMDAKLEQLKELGQLREAGVLNETEFETQKQRILGT